MDRNLALEFVRAAEAAAMAAAEAVGRGDGKLADELATKEMRARLNDLEITGRVVAGEGQKDLRGKAAMLELRESVGQGSGPRVDIAVDPLEGTALAANDQPGALTIIAGAVHPEGELIEIPPAYYAMKLAAGVTLPSDVSLDQSITKNLQIIAKLLDKPIDELTVTVLERPRHEQLIADVRAAGAKAQLIDHGDVGAAISAALPHTDVDVALGIGGLTEGYLAAVALKALGGDIVQRFWFKDEADEQAYEQRASEMEFAHDAIVAAKTKVWRSDDIVKGESFVALTGVTDGPIVRGVRRLGHATQTTSLVARSKSGTVRFIEAWHHE